MEVCVKSRGHPGVIVVSAYKNGTGSQNTHNQNWRPGEKGDEGVTTGVKEKVQMLLGEHKK